MAHPAGGDRRATPEALAEQLAGVLSPDLAPRLPLLGTLLGVHLPDNDLTVTFDTKLRKTSLESLAVQQLAELAEQEPVMLVLEDCHRLDPPSRDLGVAIARACATLPVLLALAYRAGEVPYTGLGLQRLEHATELFLRPLPPQATAQVVTDRLALLFGAAQPLPPALVELVADRAEGNPLYVRELCSYLHSRGLDLQDTAALAELDLPESLHSLVLSRIDGLAESPRRTAKVASVVGRAFRGRLLPSAYPELGSDDDVAGHLHDLAAHDVVAIEEPDSQSYLFTHAITCDVAYQSLPYSMRAVIHVDHAVAKSRFAESMRLHREVGDTWIIGLGHNNLGNAYRGLAGRGQSRESAAGCRFRTGAGRRRVRRGRSAGCPVWPCRVRVAGHQVRAGSSRVRGGSGRAGGVLVRVVWSCG